MGTAVLLAAWAWTATPAAAPLDAPYVLPVEISDIGYVRVREPNVWVRIPDAQHNFQIGDRLTLVQKNLFYYIALDTRDHMERRVVAVRRQLGDGQGSAWVTEQRDLIFGAEAVSEPGMFYLRESELMPVVLETDREYVVLCERNEIIFQLRVPKAVPGIGFIEHLPKSLVRQLQRREELRQRIVLQEEMGRLEPAGTNQGQPERLFHAERTEPSWPAMPPARRSPTPPGDIADATASQAPQPFTQTTPAVSTNDSSSTSPASPPRPAWAVRKPMRKQNPKPPPVPERIPDTAPIEITRNNRLIEELAGAVLMAAGADPAMPVASAPPQTVAIAPPTRSAPASSSTDGDDLAATEAVPPPGTAEPTDAESPRADAESVDSGAADDEPDLTLSELAVSELRPNRQVRADETAVAGVTGAVVKVLLLLVLATLTFVIVLFLLAKLVNNRPRPQRVQVSPPSQPSSPPPTPGRGDSSLVAPTDMPIAPDLPQPAGESKVSAPELGTGSSSTFTGSLHGFHISELIQFLNSTKETGTLTITENDNVNQARVIFDAGEIVNAFYGDMDAMESLAEILAFDDGFFVFKRQDEVYAERVIEQSTMSLLMNMHQEIDERVLEPQADPDPNDVFQRVAEQTETLMPEALDPPPAPAPTPTRTAAPTPAPTDIAQLRAKASQEEIDVFGRAASPAVSDTILGALPHS